MKFFKSKKKKSKSVFGSSKSSSSKHHTEFNKQTPTEVESSSFSSQIDATAAISPSWLNDNGTGTTLSYPEQAVGGRDQNCTNPFSHSDDDFGGVPGSNNSKVSSNVHHKSQNPFDTRKSDAGNAYVSGSSSHGSDGSNIAEMEASADVLKTILKQLLDKELREWADGADDSRNIRDSIDEKEDLDGLLRKTVDRMDVEPLDAEVQRVGTEVVYHLSKLRHQTKTDAKQNGADSWYATEQATANRFGSSYDEDEEEEFITDALEAILTAMEDFPDDEVLIENACLAFETISEKRNINGSAKRILEEVLLAMEGFADNPVVVSSSLGLLYNLFSPSDAKKEHSIDDLRRKLAKYALPSILHGMKEHRDDLELYTKGCKAMANFTRDDPNAQRILACKEALGLRIISEGLKYREADNLEEFAVLQRLRLQLAAIRVLKNLSTHANLEVKGKIALGGGAAQIIDRVLECLVFTGEDLIENNYHVGELNLNEEDEEDEVGISLTIMRDALQTIENLANIESVVTKDGPRSPHRPTVHRSSAIDNSSAEHIQRQLTKAVKPILNTIRQHPNRRSLQYHGMSCIRQLTVSHADSIANHGGISTFLNVLSPSEEATANDSMIHERALSCLTGLLSPSSNANGLDLVASMETEDGLDVIFRTIRRYQSNTAVIETAFESLFYLSFRVRVVLASIVGRHSSIACGVGANAARKLQSQLCLEENIFVMLGTLNQYLEASESISQRGLGLLVNVHAFLTQEQQQRQLQSDILASNGGIRLVLAVMRRHGLAVAIQEYGVGLLAGILKSAISYIAIRREFVDEEGISTVLAAMMIHPDHAAVQSHGFDVLVQLMAINKHPMEDGYSETAVFAANYKKCILEETNAVTVVQDSMERFRSNKGVQHLGSVLLQELSTTTPVTPFSALPSKAVSISTKLQTSILSLRP
jgi:hypothetical protein